MVKKFKNNIMKKMLSAYVWAWKNYEAGHESLKRLRKFYPDSDIFINVDYDGDIENYKKISDEMGATFSVNNFQVGYCGDFGDVKVGKECWTREETFEWIRGLYEACKKTDSKYMIILEEDNFITKPITLLNTDFSMAIIANINYITGAPRPNHIPNEFMIYSHNLGGVAYAPGYGAGGGCIFKPDEFAKSWEKCKDNLWNDYDTLRNINKIIGWEDFIVQFIMMIGGHEITQNFLHGIPQEDPNWFSGKNFMGQDYETVLGLKDHTIIKL